jgi:hypothetical protein
MRRVCGQQAAKAAADALQGESTPQNAEPEAANPKLEKKRKAAAAGPAKPEELIEDELLPCRPSPMPVSLLFFLLSQTLLQACMPDMG